MTDCSYLQQYREIVDGRLKEAGLGGPGHQTCTLAQSTFARTVGMRGAMQLRGDGGGQACARHIGSDLDVSVKLAVVVSSALEGYWC